LRTEEEAAPNSSRSSSGSMRAFYAKLRHGKLLRNNGSAHQRAGHSRLGRTWPRNDLDAASGTRSASGDVW